VKDKQSTINDLAFLYKKYFGYNGGMKALPTQHHKISLDLTVSRSISSHLPNQHQMSEMFYDTILTYVECEQDELLKAKLAKNLHFQELNDTFEKRLCIGK
jgi:hypothetical protein